MNYLSYFQTTLLRWLCESLLRRQMINECHTLRQFYIVSIYLWLNKNIHVHYLLFVCFRARQMYNLKRGISLMRKWPKSLGEMATSQNVFPQVQMKYFSWWKLHLNIFRVATSAMKWVRVRWNTPAPHGSSRISTSKGEANESGHFNTS